VPVVRLVVNLATPETKTYRFPVDYFFSRNPEQFKVDKMDDAGRGSRQAAQTGARQEAS
jgi:hypothetical protein